METLGERLKRLRDERKLTQQQLATRAGVGQSTITGIEKWSRQKMPSSLIEISHALGVNAYYLKTGKGERYISGTLLSEEQALIIRAFELFGDELKNNWLETAKRAIDKADDAKKALEQDYAAKKESRVIFMSEWRHSMLTATDDLIC